MGLASQAVRVQEAEGGYFWAPAPDLFTCTIGPAKKGSKFLGAKSFIEYPVKYCYFLFVYICFGGKYCLMLLRSPRASVRSECTDATNTLTGCTISCAASSARWWPSPLYPTRAWPAGSMRR